jgi:hypothetical protein
MLYVLVSIELLGLSHASRMTLVQSLTLFTSSNARWTTTQEKTISRDYPFTDVHLETPDQFVVRTYLQFLWLPEVRSSPEIRCDAFLTQSKSIMPINLLVPSLHRVQDASLQPPDSPHPLHALLHPLLLSVRSAVAKYHTELPQILAQDGGEGELEESMMWYALGYEMGEVGQGGASVNNEDANMLEEISRSTWLERLERREWVSISSVDASSLPYTGYRFRSSFTSSNSPCLDLAPRYPE